MTRSSTTLGRPAAPAGKGRQEPTAVRSALRGGGLLVRAGLLLPLVALSIWIGAKDATLAQVWSAIWNDDGSWWDSVRQPTNGRVWSPTAK